MCTCGPGRLSVRTYRRPVRIVGREHPSWFMPQVARNGTGTVLHVSISADAVREGASNPRARTLDRVINLVRKGLVSKAS